MSRAQRTIALLPKYWQYVFMPRRNALETEWKPAIDQAELHRHYSAYPLAEDYGEPWRSIGEALFNARKKLQLSKREAADRAGISDSFWRQLEAGGKWVGGKLILPNPRPESFSKVLRAVSIDPLNLISIPGFIQPHPEEEPWRYRSLYDKLEKLTEANVQLIESLVDALLEQS
jgi:transcriptional regulator with XRE-family HTH domain